MDENRTALQDSGIMFKAQDLEKMLNIDRDNYPSLFEALAARDMVDILHKQTLGLFCNKECKFVFDEIERHNQRKYSSENADIFTLIDYFNYGYILGIRAERKRKRKHYT